MADVLTPGGVLFATSMVDRPKVEDQDRDPKPIEIPMQCEFAIVIGANEVAYDLALRLHKMGWVPLLLSTTEIIASHWDDCSALRMDSELQRLREFKAQLEDAKVKQLANNFVQELHFDLKTQLFRVRTLQDLKEQSFIGMSVVLCSDNEVKKYKSAMYKYRGLFMCTHKEHIVETLDSVTFHLRLATEDIRSQLVESADICEENCIKLVPPNPPKRFLCCC